LLLNEDSDVIEETAVKQWLQEDMKRLSLELSNFARVRDFIVKRKPFSVESGELTVTLKQKRKIIEDNYKVWIEKLYQS
jgi:long-chain acyl-CoA synthetase